MEILARQFGLLIAYLVPGFVALAGFAPLVPTVALWLRGDQTASLGAPLYALLAATAAGMVVSCFRWLILDPLMALSGVSSTPFNIRALEEQPTALQFLIENHYRFYQFYGNTLISLAWAYSINRWLGTSPLLRTGTDLGVVVLCVVLFAGCRDALDKYRNRSTQLAGQTTVNFIKGAHMTNGVDHNQGPGHDPKKPPQKVDKTQAAPKPQVPKSSQKSSKS